MLALLAILDDRRREPTTPWVDPRRIRPAPLHVHGRYRQEEVLAGLEVLRKGVLPRIQTGVFHVAEENVDLLFVTLRKTEASFSPSTMYKDYAVSPTRFHWESQNTAHPASQTGQRYLAKSSTVLLFVREEQRQANGLAAPFVFPGPRQPRRVQRRATDADRLGARHGHAGGHVPARHARRWLGGAIGAAPDRVAATTARGSAW